MPMQKLYEQISAFPREFGNWGPAYSEPYAYAADISNGKRDR